MRFSPRLIAAVLLAAGAAACTDTRTINTPIPAGKVAGRLSLNPVFSPAAKTISASLADFGITFDHVRVRIRTTDTASVVLDTTVAFGPTSSDLVLDLTVPVNQVGESFNALVEYIGTSGPIFSGTVLVQSFAPDQSPPDQRALVLTFVGPGAKLKTITVSPKPVNLVGSQTLPLTITATDSSGASLTVPPLVFASSDESVAKVILNGSNRLVQSFGKRGQAAITATTPIGISDTLTAFVSLPAASVAVVSGDAQTGTVGTALAQPIVVQVSATDGVGVPGVSVIFGPPTGGSVGTPTVVTDVNGRAATTVTLGTTATGVAIAVSAGSLPVISATATAKPGAASAATSTLSTNNPQINADNQTPSIITVTTKDQFGNVIGTGGATVTLTTTLGHWGTGTATTTAATDNGNGTYSATLFSAQSGTATITGTVGGTAIATPSVTVTAVASVLDHFDVTLANGSPITGNIQAGVSTAVRIRALDATGNVVASYNNQTTLTATQTTLVGGNPSIIAPAAVAGVINTSVAFGQLSDGAIATLNAAGNGQVGLKTGSSSKFAVVAGPAALITAQPGDSVLIYGLDQTPDHFPTVFVTDAGGNITGRTQTVSFTVSGPCFLQGEAKTAQFQSDVEGAIVFNSSMINIPTGGADFPFSCQLVGTAVGFTAAPIQLALIVQQSNSTTFMEHTSPTWETVPNWTNGLPSSNTAFIAAAQPHPGAVAALLNSDQTIGSIDVEDGANLTLNGHTLSVFQNIDSRATGIIFGGTINVPVGANGGYLRGQSLPSVFCQSGEHSLIGQTQIFGSLTLNNCTLDVSTNSLTESQGTFATSGNGGLVMNQTAAIVEIDGNPTFGGTGSALSAGMLTIYGSLTQTGTGTFPATETHSVFIFPPRSGAADGSITFADVTTSFFSGLSISISAGHTFTINSAIQINGSLGVSGNGGTLSLPAGLFNQRIPRIDLAAPLTVLLGGGVVNAGALNLTGGTIILNGAGNLNLSNGSMSLGPNVHLSVNVTGGVTAPAAGCTAGAGVTIDGTNQQAVIALKQICHVQ